MKSLCILALASCINFSWAIVQQRSTDPSSSIAYHSFEQIINHFPNDTFYGPPPVNKTFAQRYIVNDEFYKPGGPIFLLDSGEVDLDIWYAVSLTGIMAELAQATNGLALFLEHRYYGSSIPVPDLSTDNLRWLTNDQAIADIPYFAQHVTIPGHEDENLTAPGRPWIVYGGSYAGAEAAFVMKEYGDIIYGAISSSGVVKASTGYPEWYYTIQKNAPQDCVKTIEDIVDKMDFLIAENNTKALTELKTIFGLQDLQDIRDFALTIAFPIGNPLFYPVPGWQELNWDPTLGHNDFFVFCDALTTANSSSVSIDHQLSKYTGGQVWKNLGNYANYIKKIIVPLCPPGFSLDSNVCFGTHDPTAWFNPLDFSGRRAYVYTTCLEFGQYSQGAPAGHRTLLSRSIQTDYTQRWCQWSFPKGQFNSIPPSPMVERWNKFGGLHLQADRLGQVDGGIDPWQYGCVHSPDGFPRKNTLLRPYYKVEQGDHVPSVSLAFLLSVSRIILRDVDGRLDINAEPAFIRAVHGYEIQFVKSWLADFHKWKPGTRKLQ